ncbi:MAG: tetratricopeptide repeat protein [Pyrinomonadaceae bacterium]
MPQKPLDLLVAILLFLTVFTAACSGQTEEQALENLRSLTRDGQLPPENVVADLERRFAGKRTGALARLVHGRIRFDAGDFAGAAALLDTDVFRTKTRVADEALWLRARALEKAGNNAEAMKAAQSLINDYPQSIRAKDAKFIWARAGLATARLTEVPPILAEYQATDPEAMLIIAKVYDAQQSSTLADTFYRQTYLSGPDTPAGLEAKARLVQLGRSTDPQNDRDQILWANTLFRSGHYAEASKAYDTEAGDRSGPFDAAARLRYVTALSQSGRFADARNQLALFGGLSKEFGDAYRQLVLGYARAKQWQQAKTTADEMRQRVTNVPLVAKTLIEAGQAAKDAKDNVDASYFFTTAVAAYPNDIAVAPAQFEAAWMQHDAKNFGVSSQMFIDHLARYADKDTSNRGKAGYWAARDSERTGKTAEACALYDGTIYRYGSNWYGYLAAQRIAAMRAAGQCQTTAAPNAAVAKAVANLRTVTVAAETAGQREMDLVAKADELSIVGLFDWAMDQINDAKRTAGNSPKVNLALAQYYRILMGI